MRYGLKGSIESTANRSGKTKTVAHLKVAPVESTTPFHEVFRWSSARSGDRPAADASIWMSNDLKKSKWKRETDGGIFSGASLAMKPDGSFNPCDEGRAVH